MQETLRWFSAICTVAVLGVVGITSCSSHKGQVPASESFIQQFSLPLYPGAKLIETGMQALETVGPFHRTAQVAAFGSQDPNDRVLEFYRRALGVRMAYTKTLAGSKATCVTRTVWPENREVCVMKRAGYQTVFIFYLQRFRTTELGRPSK
jgi:hypothetical protein